MSARTAKSRVIRICEALALAYPRVPDVSVQDAAIDLHDIEIACEKVAAAVRRLRTAKVSKRCVSDCLSDIEVELLDHVAANHLPSLRKFLMTCDNESRHRARTRSEDTQ
jgi:hypothetical protein